MVPNVLYVFDNFKLTWFIVCLILLLFEVLGTHVYYILVMVDCIHVCFIDWCWVSIFIFYFSPLGFRDHTGGVNFSSSFWVNYSPEHWAVVPNSQQRLLSTFNLCQDKFSCLPVPLGRFSSSELFL